MSLQQPPQDIPQYTARNSDRWQQPDHGKAAKHLPTAAATQRADDRQARIRKAVALRASYRLDRDWHVAMSGDPYRMGLQSVLFYLLNIREAESLEALLARDRHLCGMIDGAHAFRAITVGDMHRLGCLRENAFSRRHDELIGGMA